MNDAALWDGEHTEVEPAQDKPAPASAALEAEPAGAVPSAAPAAANSAPGATPELRLLPYYPFDPESPFTNAGAQAPFVGVRAEPAKPSAERPPRDWKRLAAAASLAAVVAIVGAAAATHVQALRATPVETATGPSLDGRLQALSARLESLEANRSRDEFANMRKVVAEIKTSAASARDVGGAVTVLAARVDKLEKDQGAKLDKLGDRMDHDSAARLADVAARLDKLEAKTSAAVAASAASAASAKAAVAVASEAASPPKPVATPPVKPVAAAPAKTEVAKAPSVAYEATGAIERPRPTLRGFRVAEIHNGYAMIDSPNGEFAVGPGDMVPGGGRVVKIERRGGDWVVVTTIGQIVAMDD